MQEENGTRGFRAIEIVGREIGDHFGIFCSGCDAECGVRYLGADSEVARIRAECPRCGGLTVSRLRGWGGLPGASVSDDRRPRRRLSWPWKRPD